MGRVRLSCDVVVTEASASHIRGSGAGAGGRLQSCLN